MRHPALAAAAICLGLAAARCGPEATGSGNLAPPPDGGFTVGSADAGVGVDGGTGGSPDGGAPSADECAGIAPESGQQAVTITVPHSPGQECWDATVDQRGNLAADVRDGPWSTYSPSGATLGANISAGTLWPQEEGFAGVRLDNRTPTLFFWAPNGSVSSRAPVGADSTRATAFGGSTAGIVVVAQDCSSGSGGLSLTRFDGQARASASQRYGEGGCASAAAVFDANGNTLLVIWPGSSAGLGGDELAARWFGPDAKALTAWFAAGRGASPSTQVMLRPLIGGGAALQVDGNWTATFRSGTASADAPFPWLAPRTDIATIRKGRAYALEPRGSESRDVIQLVSASGKSCGAIRFSANGLGVSADGTVVGFQGDGGCTHPFWPGLLK